MFAVACAAAADADADAPASTATPATVHCVHCMCSMHAVSASPVSSRHYVMQRAASLLCALCVLVGLLLLACSSLVWVRICFLTNLFVIIVASCCVGLLLTAGGSRGGSSGEPGHAQGAAQQQLAASL